MRGTPAELAALVGQRLLSVRRRGKFLLMRFERDEIACYPVLTGRFQLSAPGDKLPSKTAVVLGVGPRSAGVPDAAPWTRGAAWLPADGARAEVRYREPTQMGKIYLLRAGVERAVPDSANPSKAPMPTIRP